jgi:hypothetical protein
MITISDDARSHRIDRRIYGQFAEHLGRGIYEGIWIGEDSGIPHRNGIRSDVVAALRAIKVPVVRWPGGCFADEYHWRRGIGPRAERPTTGAGSSSPTTTRCRGRTTPTPSPSPTWAWIATSRPSSSSLGGSALSIVVRSSPGTARTATTRSRPRHCAAREFTDYRIDGSRLRLTVPPHSIVTMRVSQS